MISKRIIYSIVLSFVLCFTMCFTFMPQEASAQEFDTLTFHLAEGGRLWDFETWDINSGSYDQYLFGLYSPGNYFTLDYADGTDDEFIYVESENRFFPDGDTYFDPIDIDVEYFDNGIVSYGPNWARLSFRYKGVYYDTEVPFRGVRRTNIEFSKKKYYYDGKVHTPSYKITLDDGKNSPVPSSDIKSIRWDKGRKNVGVYALYVAFDTTKDYVDEEYDIIEIYPTKPVITKIKAGKKTATIKWKKFSKAQQSQIKRFKIEYSTDKKFNKGVKHVYAKKSQYYKTIKKLKREKTYYFRVIAIGNCKQEDVDWLDTSSKTKKTKVK